MSPLNQPLTGRRYWRSLDELADTPEFRRFVTAEFPNLASLVETPATRRQFLKVMGASLALAGLTGCRWPKETIVPATKQPVNRVPGQSVQYATTVEQGGVATGLLVTSFDGRPIKIEGNPEHPYSRGKTSARMQASVLDLYDPDRSQRPVQREWLSLGYRAEPPALRYRTWNEFTAFAKPHFEALRDKRGAGLAFLSEASSSPTLADMRQRLAKAFPEALWYEYEPLSRDNEIEGTRLALDRPRRLHWDLAQADVIVSLDSDFLMTHPAALKYAADFAARRRADDGTMNRLYVFESNYSVTGSNADQRYAVRSADLRNVLRQIALELAKLVPGEGGGAEVGSSVGKASLPADVATVVAKDLAAHRGRCVLMVGPQQPPEVHAEALEISRRYLGAFGTTLRFTQEPAADRPTQRAALAELTQRMQRGQVQTLVILGGNPVYDAPADLGFAAQMAAVPTTIHLSEYDNETSQRCTWHLPKVHYLEAWGDARAYDGTLSLVQPLIEPLYDGRTAIELLALLTDDPLKKGYDLVRRTFEASAPAGAAWEDTWRVALHDGVLAQSAWPWEDAGPAANANIAPPIEPAAGWELVFAPDYSVFDGRSANNGWLQEMPDPITKLTWDNAALVSPRDAAKLGLTRNGDMLKIEAGGRSLELAAYVLPGHADGSITLPLGYGRGLAAGKVAAGTGFDTYKLRTTKAADILTGAQVTAAGKHYELAGTQDHHAIDSAAISRQGMAERVPTLVREATLKEYKQEPEVAKQRVELPVLQSLWKEKEYTGHRWGMAIDLTACIGCGACVVACQAENNVPVVGKEEVAKGREMHWIRVDRYFSEGAQGPRAQGAKGEDSTSTPSDRREVRERIPAPAAPASAPSASRPLDPSTPSSSIQIVHQPLPCQHCELAPCEGVCPVAATVHDEEGLNVMVYNRCVGTRYCSNNCPYKVRRFNWFWNHHGPGHPRSKADGQRDYPGRLKQIELLPVEQLQHNPDVTVRSRGVMEKCTYCTHRINAVKLKARNENWPSIPDGAITPACAQACPTDAIVFGDLADPNSRVRKAQEHARSYALLGELNVKPRTQYLAKLRNPAEE